MRKREEKFKNIPYLWIRRIQTAKISPPLKSAQIQSSPIKTSKTVSSELEI